jgi:cyclopropane fatty-acyl-phospholipid synthase-like methyltransferase
VLELGCGWGAPLNYAKNIGAIGVGYRLVFEKT